VRLAVHLPVLKLTRRQSTPVPRSPTIYGVLVDHAVKLTSAIVHVSAATPAARTAAAGTSPAYSYAVAVVTGSVAHAAFRRQRSASNCR
jgi:hypothetical protein